MSNATIVLNLLESILLFQFITSHGIKFIKACILLSTCGVTRAVNIELTKDLGNESLILALLRFLAKRGKAELNVSDNF